MAILRARTRPRRRALMAPFVATALLAPGCAGPSQASDPTAPVTGTSGGQGGGSDEPTPDENAPAPGAPPRPAPEGKGAWSQVGGFWTFLYDDGDRITFGEDGTCRLMQHVSCGEDGEDGPTRPTCNPPPPQDVQCPPGLPAPPAKP